MVINISSVICLFVPLPIFYWVINLFSYLFVRALHIIRILIAWLSHVFQLFLPFCHSFLNFKFCTKKTQDFYSSPLRLSLLAVCWWLSKSFPMCLCCYLFWCIKVFNVAWLSYSFMKLDSNIIHSTTDVILETASRF